MEKIKVAFATNDGKTFMDNHFGDADFYEIYEIDEINADYLKRINNTTEEEDEEVHADPKKAKGITGLLKKENVKIVVSKVFGPNIKRIKKKFVCILMNDNSIDKSLKCLCKNFKKIASEWNMGEERKYLNLKK